MPDTDPQRLAEVRREVYGDLEDLLTYDEVCAVLGVSRWTVTRMVSDGRFTVIRTGGRRRFIAKSQVAAYLRECAQQAGHPAADAAEGAAKSLSAVI